MLLLVWPNFAGNDVVHRADCVAAAAGQPRIGGCGDAERREVARSDREIVGGREVLEPPLEVANLDRDARHQLLLNRRAELPVSRTDAPPVEQRGVDGRGGSRRGAERRRARGGAFAVGGIVGQVALRDVIPVARRSRPPCSIVGPRAGGRRRDARDRVGDRVVVVQVAGRVHVLADVDLHRRLAVAEDVVGHAAARRDVLVVDARRFRERQRRRQEGLAVNHGWTNRLCRRVAPRIVETECALQRHPTHRPLVLTVQRRVPDPIRLCEDPEALGERGRPAAVERVRQVQIVAEVLDVFHQVAADIPELHRVGAGHVRRGRAPRVRVVPVMRPVRRTIGRARQRATQGLQFGDPARDPASDCQAARRDPTPPDTTRGRPRGATGWSSATTR